MTSEWTEKQHNNLLKSEAGKASYRALIASWSTSRIRRTMGLPCSTRNVRRDRNGLLYDELRRRRENGRP